MLLVTPAQVAMHADLKMLDRRAVIAACAKNVSLFNLVVVSRGAGRKLTKLYRALRSDHPHEQSKPRPQAQHMKARRGLVGAASGMITGNLLEKKMKKWEAFWSRQQRS